MSSLEDGGGVQAFGLDAIPQDAQGSVQIYADLAFDIAFSKGGPCAGQPVRDCLIRIRNAVAFITGYMEMWFAPGFRFMWNADLKLP